MTMPHHISPLTVFERDAVSSIRNNVLLFIVWIFVLLVRQIYRMLCVDVRVYSYVFSVLTRIVFLNYLFCRILHIS